MVRIGVLSDTHGVLPDDVFAAFEGVERIVHAGDVGSPRVLDLLGAIAPVIAVRGNTDADDYGGALVPLANFKAGGVRVLVVHRPEDVPCPLPEGVRVVITGHTHKPVVEERLGVLWLNPGSPSRARSGSGHSVAILEIEGERPSARLVRLS